MSSKRRHEGYLLIDHRCSPGLTDAQMRVLGPDTPRGAGLGVYEAPTYTCSHCQHVVVLNPLRTRARGYCTKCDHYVCDACEAVRVASGGVCKTFKQVVEELLEQAVATERRSVST